MKRKFLACVLSTCMVAGTLAGCGETPAPATGDDTTPTTGEETTTEPEAVTDTIAVEGAVGTIYVCSFTDEVPGMIQDYVANHPDFKYNVEVTVKATDGGAYDTYMANALSAGGETAPDIYAAEAAFVLKYTQGDMAEFAAPYSSFGITSADVDAAEIAPYTIDLGSNPAGELVALGYQSTGGCMIYRRSIANDVFGTDDPDAIAEKVGAGSGNWDAYWAAADEVKAKGYAMVSGQGDLWNVVEKSAATAWIVDDKLNIDPAREEFMDISKKLCDNGYYNDTTAWQDAWFADMAGTGDKQVFSFFGPAWLINYTLGDNCGGKSVGEGTFGDWAVCPSPVGFFWGGTWVIGSKKAAEDADKAAAVGEIIRYITVDTSEDGLQYKWANGMLNDAGTKDSVASNVVMAKSNGEMAFLAGQNAFDVFVPANTYARGDNQSQYDEKINGLWTDQCSLYAHGEKSREDAIADFKTNVSEALGIDVE